MKRKTHKQTPKKINKSPKKFNNKKYALILIIMGSILLGLVVGIYYGNQIDDVAHDIKDIATLEVKDKEKKPLTFEEKTKALEINYVGNVDKNIYIENIPSKTNEKTIPFHYEEPNLEEIDKKIEENSLIDTEHEEEKKEKVILNDTTPSKTKSTKPKLAIIIDDMTTQRQINSTKDLGYVVNMSFLPPTKGHKNSAIITKNLEQYMIHLPLQASNFMYEEENTLHIEDSLETIENRIKYLRKIYPTTNFINNHTGSKFTANLPAMEKLFEMLKKYNYTFLDSRTTAKSVTNEVAKKYGVKIFTRNIFLDNKKDKQYIQNQLKKAIKIAKKNGVAIAIGHPYGITFKTLKESKYLLEGLDLVYIQEL